MDSRPTPGTTAERRMPPGSAHHELTAHEVVLLLETDAHRGLPDQQADQRLREYGPNALPTARGSGVLTRILQQVNHPLIYVLLAAGLVTALLAEYVDSAVIFGVVVVNAVVGFVQESKAEAALDSLRAMTRTPARVVRDGRERTVPSEDVVPGDLVVLDAGDKVPADLRLTRSSELQVDESALTGESVPVAKDEVVLPGPVPVADRRNMTYAGSLVTAGSGRGVVVATGAGTELGEIHRLVATAELLRTPLTRKLGEFSRLLTVAILALAVATFAVGSLRGQDAVETFTAAIALAVGAIPEGLPAAVTITLAIGVSRMARRRAVIRRLPAVETLGSTTVICSDKTGTLTENQMTTRTVWTPTQRYDVSGTGYAPVGDVRDACGEPVRADVDEALRWSLLAGAACNDSALVQDGTNWRIVGDPTEAAMLVVAAKAGLTPDMVGAALPRLAVLPFTSERGLMATLHTVTGGLTGGLAGGLTGGSAAGPTGDTTNDTANGPCQVQENEPTTGPAAGPGEPPGPRVVLAKGAAERLLDLCTTQLDEQGRCAPLDRLAVSAAAAAMAGSGMRVLATALGTGQTAADSPAAFEEGRAPGGLVLTGLHALLDPPRAAAPAAVKACRSAGISVKLITGDHAATAAAIAHQTGLIDADAIGAVDEPAEGTILTGSQIAATAVDDLPEAVERAVVLARVSPEQKLRLVEALQARGHVVAMTGDGVNDAPALRRANIGVAMGRGGTEVAKDAADMVLTDDDFATIEAAVEEGRGVFDNLTKFITWTLPTNIGEGLVILAAIVAGAALPILPTQILWINMTTAVALGLMLAFEPKERGIMRRPPRDPQQPLLTRALMMRILLVSSLLVAGSWWLFEWELANGAALAEARTAAVNLFVVVEAFYLFSCRSLTMAPWRIGLLSNRWIVAGVALQALGQVALTYLPAMNTLFGTAPIDAPVWLRILAIASLTSLVVAVDKRLRRPATVTPEPGHDVRAAGPAAGR